MLLKKIRRGVGGRRGVKNVTFYPNSIDLQISVRTHIQHELLKKIRRGVGGRRGVKNVTFYPNLTKSGFQRVL